MSLHDYDYTVSMLPVCIAEQRIREGGRMAVELTKLSGEDEVPYGDVHEMLANQMVSSADYGALVTAMLEYHDDDSFADDIYGAIENALADYIDREWTRVCGIGNGGQYKPKLVDDRFMR